MVLYVGLISGTSMDAIDAALVDIEGTAVSLTACAEFPYPAALKGRLERLVRTRAAAIDEIGSLHTALGQSFANAALRLLADTGVEPAQVKALGSHGQTIGHRIVGSTPYTLQIGDPHVIALRTGIRTVADFRAMDVAAGGQGAPLVPGFHRHVFRRDDRDVAVVNIGGIANVTLLRADPAMPLIGFDCGPGNTLMDVWIDRHRSLPFDDEGAWAASGTPDDALLQVMMSDDYFAQPAPKSTGREAFHLEWLDRQLASLNRVLAPADVQATLARLTVVGIISAIDAQLPNCREVLVCGGGARNQTLMQLLRDSAGSGRTVLTTDQRGWPSGAIEACTFAWLASRRLAHLPGNVPSVTGASAAVLLGAVYEAV